MDKSLIIIFILIIILVGYIYSLPQTFGATTTIATTDYTTTAVKSKNTIEPVKTKVSETMKQNDIQIINTIMKSLYNGDQLDGYRLADCIMYPDYFTRKDTAGSVVHLLYKYPNTICDSYIKSTFPVLSEIRGKLDADDYLSNVKYTEFKKYVNDNIKKIKVNVSLLNDLISEKENKGVYPDLTQSDLILHIRIGDIMCQEQFKAGISQYSKKGNDKWWNRVVEYIYINKIKNVYIMAGSHFNDCIRESALYIFDRRNYLLDNGVANVYFILGNSPDEDLIFASKTYHFITTGGGYGFFLGNIIKKIGKGNFSLFDHQKGGLRLDLNVFG